MAKFDFDPLIRLSFDLPKIGDRLNLENGNIQYSYKDVKISMSPQCTLALFMWDRHHGNVLCCAEDREIFKINHGILETLPSDEAKILNAQLKKLASNYDFIAARG